MNLKNLGNLKKFIGNVFISNQIRRIIALTGPEAERAAQRAEQLQQRLGEVKAKVEDLKSQLTQKEAVRLITELTEDISAAVISYWLKDEMRNKLKVVKKAIDDKDRARKAALLTEVTNQIADLHFFFTFQI